MACQPGSFEVDQFDGRIGIDRFGAQDVALFDVGRCHRHQERAVIDREVDRATQSVFVTCFSGVDEEVIAAGTDHLQSRIDRGQASGEMSSRPMDKIRRRLGLSSLSKTGRRPNASSPETPYGRDGLTLASMMSAVRVKASLFSSSYSPGGVGDSARTMLAPKRRWLIPSGIVPVSSSGSENVLPPETIGSSIENRFVISSAR